MDLAWNEAPSNITDYKMERTGGSYGTEEFGGSILPHTSIEQMEPDTSYTFTVSFGTSSTHFGPGSTITVRTLAIPAPTNLRLDRIFTNETKAGARFLWDNPTQTTGLQHASATYDANRENEADLLTHANALLFRGITELDTETVYQFATWYRTEDQNGTFHDGPKAYLEFTTPKLPEITISDATAEEGHDITFTVSVTKFAAHLKIISVTLRASIATGTAEASDFPGELHHETLQFHQNETSKQVLIPTAQDSIHEEDETFSADLANVHGAVITRESATGTIIDDDPLPLVSILNPDREVSEDVGMLNITVSNEQLSEAPVNVNLLLQGTATEDTDYTAQTKTLTVDPLQLVGYLSIDITDDDIYEGAETIIVSIADDPTNYRIKDRNDHLTFTIIDNDPAPRLAVTALTGTEGGQNQSSIPVPGQEFGNVVFQLDLDRPAGVPISILVDSVNGTAVVGDDYHNVPGAWIIPEGETSVRYKIPITDDNLFEGGRHEYFEIVLSNPDPPIFTGEKRITAYIKDNDAPPAGVDYVGDTTDTTGAITVGESWLNDNPVNGRIEADYDYDWYRTELQRGHCYQIEARGKGHTESGDAQGLTLKDPVLRGVYTQYGNYMEGTQNDDGGAHLAALKTVKIDADSVVYISVMSGQPEERGIFDLSLIDLGTAPETCTGINPSVTDAWASTETDAPKTVSEPVGGDLPQDVTTIGYVRPNGEPATGKVETTTDPDFYKIPLVAGFRYTIELKGDQPSDYGGTLGDPALYIRDPNGNRIIITDDSTLIKRFIGDEPSIRGDNNSGTGNNAKLKVWVKTTDTYMIQAEFGDNFLTNPGTYTLVVTRR